MSILDSPPLSLETSESSESSVAHSEHTAQPQFDLALRSPRTFSRASSVPSVTTTMMSTSEPHLPQPLQPFSALESSHGIPGTLQPHLPPHCHADPSNSLTKAFFYTYPCQKQTNSVSVTTFHYLPLGMPAVPYVRSEHYSSVIPDQVRTHSSRHLAAPSTKNGSRTISRGLFSKPASTPRHTLVTPSAVVQPMLLSQQASQGTRSKEWVVGSQMQWTDIFQNQPPRLNSFPPTGGSTWPPRVRRAPLHSLPVPNRADSRSFRTPGLAFQRGCLAADTAVRAFGPVLG